MTAALSLSNDSRTTAGILLLTIVAVEFGGLTMLRIVRGHQPATEFQRSLRVPGTLTQASSSSLHWSLRYLPTAPSSAARPTSSLANGIWAAAVLFPAGFFLSSAGRGTTQPNRLIVLVYAGAVALTAGVLALGIGLLTA
jgi:hypothetical protein